MYDSTYMKFEKSQIEYRKQVSACQGLSREGQFIARSKRVLMWLMKTFCIVIVVVSIQLYAFVKSFKYIGKPNKFYCMQIV